MTQFDQDMANRIKAILVQQLTLVLDVKYPDGGDGNLVAEIWFDGDKVAENDIKLRDLKVTI